VEDIEDFQLEIDTYEPEPEAARCSREFALGGTHENEF
jgi:hypothetical protein